jgi:hypothetical protein
MSFPGQPLVDMRLTRDSKGERVEQVVGEFGEPLRTGPDVVSWLHTLDYLKGTGERNYADPIV